MGAFVFVPLLAATWVVGLAVLAHAGTYLLSIVESSATGMAQSVAYKGRSFRNWMRDGVDWPDEPFADYLLKGLFAAYLVMLCLGPSILLSTQVVEGYWRTVIAGGLFWFTFPIVMLSSLASDSRWAPLHTGILIGMTRRPVATACFYALSLPVLGLLFLTFDLIFIHRSGLATSWSVGLSFAATLAFFAYARMIGRLGLVLSYAMPERREKPAKTRGKKRRRWSAEYDAKYRWGIPTEEIPNDVPRVISPEGEVEAYGINHSGTIPEEPPKPAPKVHVFEDEDDSPIIVAEPDERPTNEWARRRAAALEPSAREMELYIRERPAEPTSAFGGASWAFLLDPKTIEPWLRLTLGVVALALMQRGLDMLRPD